MELECFDSTAWNRYYSIFDKRCGFSLSSRTTFALSKLVLVQRLDKSRRLLKIENFKRQSHLFPQIPPQHIKFLGWHFEIPLSIQKGANLSSLQINPKQSTKTIVGYLFHEQAIIVKFQGFFLCHFFLFLDFILFPVDLTLWRMYEICMSRLKQNSKNTLFTLWLQKPTRGKNIIKTFLYLHCDYFRQH